jgi:tetratricopeptide (TPR) repeat protein
MRLFYVLLALVSLAACRERSEQKNDFPAENSLRPISSSIPLCYGTGVRLSHLTRLPSPTVWHSIGNSHLKISTTNIKAQKWFDQGLNLLHDFMYFEAYRAFAQASQEDSTCAMAYWGIVMSLRGEIEEGHEQRQRALVKAVKYRFKVTRKEALLIDAAQKLVEKGYAASYPIFRQLYNEFSDDADVAAFTSLMLLFGNKKNKLESRQIAEKALKHHPEHVGLLHYYMHIMEPTPEFEKTIPHALLIQKLAKSASHIQHMPGHVYFAKGDYLKAAKYFETAYRVDSIYHQTQKVSYLDNDNYLHNLHFWCVVLTEMGDKPKALKIASLYANSLIQIQRQRSVGALMIAYEGIIRPAFVYIRLGEWSNATQIIESTISRDKNIHPNTLIFFKGLKAYCQAMDQLQSDRFEGLETLVEQMETARKKLDEQQTLLRHSPEKELIIRALQILAVGYAEVIGWINNSDSSKPIDQAPFFHALQLEAKIGSQDPPRLAYPVFEGIGRFFIKRKDWPNAAVTLEKALLQRPRSRIILTELIRVNYALNDLAKAKKYEKILSDSSH